MEKDILEGNAKIAEFMGGKLVINSTYNFPISFGLKETWDEGGYVGTDESSVWSLDEMEYHSSWEWLMPVWFKFRSLVFKNWELHEHRNWKKRIVHAITNNEDPIYAFRELLDAIDWYNTNHPNRITN